MGRGGGGASGAAPCLPSSSLSSRYQTLSGRPAGSAGGSILSPLSRAAPGAMAVRGSRLVVLRLLLLVPLVGPGGAPGGEPERRGSGLWARESLTGRTERCAFPGEARREGWVAMPRWSPN